MVSRLSSQSIKATIPVFAGISSGFRVIVVTIAASAFGAWKFPHDPDGKEAGQDESQKEGAE